MSGRSEQESMEQYVTRTEAEIKRLREAVSLADKFLDDVDESNITQNQRELLARFVALADPGTEEFQQAHEAFFEHADDPGTQEEV